MSITSLLSLASGFASSTVMDLNTEDRLIKKLGSARAKVNLCFRMGVDMMDFGKKIKQRVEVDLFYLTDHITKVNLLRVNFKASALSKIRLELSIKVFGEVDYKMLKGTRNGKMEQLLKVNM